MGDGPIGVRGRQWRSADPSIALPSPTAPAATWDVDLVRRGSPAFWFGHGLSDTTWSYDAIAAEGTTVTVSVTDPGGRAGREVVQVYARTRPAAFDVVEAEPGQTVVTTMFLPERAFQVRDGGWRTVEGEHVVRAGRNAADLPLAATVKI